MELNQVVLRIIPEKGQIVKTGDGESVTSEAIHKVMKRRGVWHNDVNGKYIDLSFDGKSVTFRLGMVLQFDRTVAEALMKSSNILVGSDTENLSAPFVPFLQVVEQFAVGEQKENTPTSCPYCYVDQLTRPKLARHLMEAHVNDAEEPKEIESDEEPAETVLDEETDAIPVAAPSRHAHKNDHAKMIAAAKAREAVDA